MHTTTKKIWRTTSTNATKQKNIEFRVKTSQNTMFFVLFPANVSNFAQESKKAEFVHPLFLTNPA